MDILRQKKIYTDNSFIKLKKKSEIIYEKYLGVADRSWNIPVTKDTKFDIASVNKSMIAALILKAVEESQLQLTDTLQDLLHKYTCHGRFHPDITIHQMLSHTSGLPDYDSVNDSLRRNQFLFFKRLRFKNAEYVDFISRLDPVNNPKQQFAYSNFAYHLICIILEDVYEKPFEEILKEKLTSPLGLSNTVSCSTNERVIKKLAKGYNYQKGLDTWHQNAFIDLSLGRRIFSTPSDLNRWGQVMSNPGWLNAESLRLMHENHVADIDPRHSYGYGWVVINNKNKSEMIDLDIDREYIVHGGRTEGYKSMLVNINRGEYVISFLSNVGNRTDEKQLAQQIVNLLNIES